MGRDRLGLRMLAACLVVVALVIGLVTTREIEFRREQARTQGLSLARTLARVPMQELVESGSRLGPLQIAKTAQANSDFAYAVVTDVEGRVLAEVASPGIVVPVAPVSVDPTSWIGESLLAGAQPLRDFRAPVLDQSRLVGHIRVGFVEPSAAILLEGLPFHGALALLVLALTPGFYWLMRREMAPLSNLSDQFQSLREISQAPVEFEATGSLKDFIGTFNQFLQLTEGRIVTMREEQTELLAETTVLSHDTSRYEALFDALPEAALALDDGGRLCFVNARAISLLGIDKEQAFGAEPAAWEGLGANLAEALAEFGSGRSQRSGEREIAVPGLTPTLLQLRARPIVATDGSSLGTLIVLRDSSADDQAQQAQEDFLTHVAHELKSPLTVLSMYAESLLSKRGADEVFRIDACNSITDQVERLNVLVHTLLSIARIEGGRVVIEPSRVRLADFLTDSFEAATRQHQGAYEFVLNLDPDLSPIVVDKELFRIAINNLLSNAIKYNRPGGVVTLSASEVGEDLVICVEDSGIGIAEDELEAVFSKFFRSESPEAQKREGHGLGLPLAREIVRLHGGEIRVETVQDEGTRFSVVFPKSRIVAKSAGE